MQIIWRLPHRTYTCAKNVGSILDSTTTLSRYSAVTTRLFSNSTPSAQRGGNEKSRPDPFARRPNKKCDPYGQEGKPLSAADAQRLLATVHPDWSLKSDESEKEFVSSMKGRSAALENPPLSAEEEISEKIPFALSRKFVHTDFLQGSSFLKHVAAVAQMNDHFPRLTLERQLDSRRKAWTVVSTVSCRTVVLQGLSHHDFFLATLIDVEIQRPEVQSLLLSSEK